MFTTRLLGAQRSADGETTKLLVQLQDGLQVEAVIMQYDNTGEGWGGTQAWAQGRAAAD
jgi:adenine C2-methylase RlmN of 23S rRNA A2503 and tRNA A37